MNFSNSFSIAAPLEQVWAVLLQPEQVAPCVPGAEITEKLDERHFKGQVTVKLGPVRMNFKGEIELEPDEEARTVTIRGKGSEARGFGRASGSAISRLSQNSEGGTEVTVDSQVDIGGKLAQFGRGIIQDVSNRMVRDFASCLEEKLRQG